MTAQEVAEGRGHRPGECAVCQHIDRLSVMQYKKVSRIICNTSQTVL